MAEGFRVKGSGVIELSEQELEQRARISVLRSLLFYGFVLFIDVAVLVYIATGPPRGFGWISLAVTVVLGLLLVHQVWQHAWDVRADAVQMEDKILRKFQRAELIFVWQNNYLQVGRTIFSVDPRDYLLVEEGQRIRVRYFPHSLKVVSAVRSE